MVQATIEQYSSVREPSSTAHAVLAALAQRGVRAAFGVPGGLISPVYDALVEVPAIRAVTARHEAMAAFAAMGHATATGMPALCLTTSGPGITNAITGIAAAFAEGIPMIVIAGEVARSQSSRGAVQDSTRNGLDIVAMLRTMTRWSAVIEHPSLAVSTVEQALRHATGSRPGPVFLSLPVDVSNAAASPTSRLAVSEPPRAAEPDERACREAAELLSEADRPLFVLGAGARTAVAEIASIARRLAIPVVTTPHAKGLFPESDPLHLGVIGFGGHPSAYEALARGRDVVMIVGSRLGDNATNSWSLPVVGSKATIQIDRDPWLIGTHYPVTLGIIADARSAVRKIGAELPVSAVRPVPPSHGIRRLYPELFHSDATPLTAPRVMMALQAAFPDAFFSVDIGEHCAYALHYLSIDEPDRFRAMVGLGSMGSGIGTAIGVRHAQPDRPVVGICGDGGFLMWAGAIHTCVEHGIDPVIAVMNDGGYNIVNHGFEKVFGRVPSCLPSRAADLAGVARDLGAIGARIDTVHDLHPGRLRALAGRGRPVVLDIRFDPSLALSVESRSASIAKSAFGGAV